MRTDGNRMNFGNLKRCGLPQPILSPSRPILHILSEINVWFQHDFCSMVWEIRHDNRKYKPPDVDARRRRRAVRTCHSSCCPSPSPRLRLGCWSASGRISPGNCWAP